MKFSEKIIQARKAKNLTQEDLAEAVGVSRQAVSKWETEEAKPDLDKLVSICLVLDLSMDYLCLDKRAEVTAEPPKQKEKVRRYHVLGVCIGLLIAIAAGGIALALRQEEPPAPDDDTPVAQETQIDYAEILEHMKVADAKIRSNTNNTFTIIFMPSIQVADMQVQIAAHHNKSGLTGYLDVTKQASGYVAQFNEPPNGYDVDFYAVCTIGEVTVKLPLIHLDGDKSSCTWWDLWKE